MLQPGDSGGPPGGVHPNVGGYPAPFRAPFGTPLGNMWALLFGSRNRSASGASFGSTPRRPLTARGAPEQVNYRVNSMSPIFLPVRSKDAPEPLLESQPAPLGALIRVAVRLKQRYRNGWPSGGRPGPMVPDPGAPWGEEVTLRAPAPVTHLKTNLCRTPSEVRVPSRSFGFFPCCRPLSDPTPK